MQLYLMILDNTMVNSSDATALSGNACHINTAWKTLSLIYNVTSFAIYTIYPEVTNYYYKCTSCKYCIFVVQELGSLAANDLN